MNLVMGYGADHEAFLASGKRTADFVRSILARENLSIGASDSVMEWGCASGRVLRHFESEARVCDFWGVDQDSDHIDWAKENISPPFKFVTSTAYPHFPFEDGKFKLVYAMSVFTHIFHLIDMWLMEFKRIMAPGG
jgi:ubiquinone/menaquinone biosynthesis C-methylase UbiE